MKLRNLFIGLVFLLAVLTACDATTHEARRMVKRAELLADTLPDSTVRLIDSVLRMPANFSERERMDMALLQAEALFGERGDAISPIMDDDFFDDHSHISTSPELERASAYYARKKQFNKAAHAALYSGFVQQHYNEKESAMRSFKEAEQYGLLATDSLTVAQAEYWVGKKLIDDGMEQEAMIFLMSSERYFGNRYLDLATIENSKAVAYIVMSQYDSAEMCLQQSLLNFYKIKGGIDRVRRKIYNNYSVLYLLQGRCDHAKASLIQIANDTGLDIADSIFLCLNLGKVYMCEGIIDSASIYFYHLDILLPDSNIRGETMVSAYGSLANFAEQQGDTKKALQYKKLREEYLSKVVDQRQKQTIYRIQKQYNYENLQNVLNRKLIHRQRFITVFGILAIMGLAALAVSQIRLAKSRKQEAEIKANLFHFMQQNKELTQKSEVQEKIHKESEEAFAAMLKEKQKQEEVALEYGEHLSKELKKEQSVMLRLHLFMENQGDEILLRKLESAVFGKQTHMDAMMDNVDSLYPQLREILKQKDLGLDENEQLDVILSYFNVSRQDEALLLHKTTDMVDKIRNRSRKKIQSASQGKILPK